MLWRDVGGGEAFYSLVISWVSVFKWVCDSRLWISQCFSVFFLLLLMGWDAKSGLKLGISLPQVTYILVISQQVRLWLASLPRGQACLRTECSGVFQNGNFSPHPARSKTEFFFFDIYCGNLVKFLEVNLIVLHPLSPMSQPPGVFNSQSYSHWDSCNLSITVQVVLSQHWFPRLFQPWEKQFVLFVPSLLDPKMLWIFQSV